MPAKSNLTVQSDITVAVREIDFVTRFDSNWEALREILGIMRPIRKQPGTKLVSYKASMKSAALQGGASVTEGDEIPYTEFKVEPVAYSDVAIEKYAKAVSIEAVNKYGAAIAVQRTDEAFLNELQSNVLTRFYNFLKTGTLTAIETTWQMALAKAKGNVLEKFASMRRNVTEVVGCANINDLYSYLGAAGITVQTAFGLNYVKDFMGYSTLFLCPSIDIPEGMVIALPVENIDLYYIDPSDSDFAQLGLNYTVQGETNLVGFHANGDYSHAVGESFAILGMTLWAEYLDGVSVVKVEASGSVSTATFTSGAATTTDGATKITVTAPSTSAVTPDMHFYVKAASSAPALPSYLGSVNSTWTEIVPNASNVVDELTGFTSGHKMVMAITNGAGQVIWTSAAAGVTVVVKA